MKLPTSLTTVTTFSKILALFIFLILIGIAFKAGANYQYDVDLLQPPATLFVYPSPTISPSQNLPVIQITNQDNQKTERVKVGDRIVLQFSDKMNWKVQLSTASILQPSSDGIMYIKATQGQYKAVNPGTVDITATGSPICAPGQACPMFLAVFKTTVEVTQ